MRKRLIVVSSMLFLGVAAAVPKLGYRLGGLDDDLLTGGGSGLRIPVAERLPAAQRASASAYRPCRSRSDDRCIQVNERSVRMVERPAAPARIAVTARPAPRRVQTASLAPPPGPPVAYAGCTTLLTDDCVAAFDRIAARTPARAPVQRPRRTNSLDTPGI